MKSQTQALLDKANENLSAIELLLDKGYFTIAVGRAYYTMFYCAEAALHEQGLEFSSHGEVHGAFGREFIKSGRLPPELHKYIIDAFRQRQEADYDAPAIIERQAASELLDKARSFYAAVVQLLL